MINIKYTVVDEQQDNVFSDEFALNSFSDIDYLKANNPIQNRSNDETVVLMSIIGKSGLVLDKTFVCKASEFSETIERKFRDAIFIIHCSEYLIAD